MCCSEGVNEREIMGIKAVSIEEKKHLWTCCI